MRNKTPPICQKHQPEPPLDPATILPAIRALVIFDNVTFGPPTVWQAQVSLPLFGPGLLYRASFQDAQNIFWTIIATFSDRYETWTASTSALKSPNAAAAFSVIPRDTARPFPPDTELWVANSFVGCDNARWRFNA